MYKTWQLKRKRLEARLAGEYETLDEAVLDTPLNAAYVYVERWEEGQCRIVWDNVGMYNPLSPDVVRRLLRRPRHTDTASASPLPAPTHIRNWRKSK